MCIQEQKLFNLITPVDGSFFFFFKPEMLYSTPRSLAPLASKCEVEPEIKVFPGTCVTACGLARLVSPPAPNRQSVISFILARIKFHANAT